MEDIDTKLMVRLVEVDELINLRTLKEKLSFASIVNPILTNFRHAESPRAVQNWRGKKSTNTRGRNRP